jgi:acyl carrier protein
MNGTAPNDIRTFLTDFLNQRLKEKGQSFLSDLPEDYDLLLSGVIDSLDLVEFIVAIAERFGRTINFEELDPEEMTIVGPLCTFVSQQLETGNS